MVQIREVPIQRFTGGLGHETTEKIEVIRDDPNGTRVLVEHELWERVILALKSSNAWNSVKVLAEIGGDDGTG